MHRVIADDVVLYLLNYEGVHKTAVVFSLAEDLAFDPTTLSTSDTPMLSAVGSGIVRQSFTQQYCSVVFVCCSSFPRQCYTVCALCINKQSPK